MHSAIPYYCIVKAIRPVLSVWTLRPWFIFFAFALILFCGLNICSIESKRRTFKQDLIELSKIKYGLFSVDEWKNIISIILSKKIEELDFTAEQKEEMRVKVSGFLYSTIEDFEARFFEEKSQSVIGWVQGGVTSLTGMFAKFKRDVPVFTEQILDFLSREENRDRMKDYIMEKFTEYTDKTFSRIDYAEHDRILSKYQYGDRTATLTGLQDEMNGLHIQVRKFIIIVFLCIIFLGVMIVFSPVISRSEYFLYTCNCFCLLGYGLFLPMIEIDARIENMSFTLMGEPVDFKNQILYFKSKSILEVVRLMLFQGKWDVLIVGVMVLVFSVLFPVSKLLASVVFIQKPTLHSNRFIRFLVFKTGKWSMADVMVIAIFMAYIGFSSILTEQLRQLDNLTNTLDILTTNNSSLQVGFFLFTSFAILSLLIAHRLQYNHNNKPIIY